MQLTRKGSDLQAATEDVWERLEQRTFANFTPEEQATLRRLLQQLYENVSEEV
ncbi:MAG: hypothetical protein IH859_03130 [Chloroflexi bacterium]|nr:hypothetical protein [Chloroflexota bacterium]